MQEALGIALIIVGIGLLIFGLVNLILTYQAINAELADPFIYCSLHEYPYIQLCEQQKQENIISKLLERAKEWNNTH